MYIKLTETGPIEYTLSQLKADNPNISFPETISELLLIDFNVYSYKCKTPPKYDDRTQLLNALFVNEGGQWYLDYEVTLKDEHAVAAYDDALRNSIKLEAQRRILEIAPDWKQRNMAIRMAQLAAIGVNNWTSDEHTEYSTYETLWKKIEHIRSRSNMLEESLCTEYQNDDFWIQ